MGEQASERAGQERHPWRLHLAYRHSHLGLGLGFIYVPNLLHLRCRFSWPLAPPEGGAGGSGLSHSEPVALRAASGEPVQSSRFAIVSVLLHHVDVVRNLGELGNFGGRSVYRLHCLGLSHTCIQ